MLINYSWPYLILFLFFLFLYYVDKRTAKKKGLTFLEKVALFSYLIFYGLRGYIFTDCFQYHDLFTNIHQYEIRVNYLELFGPGYLLGNAIISIFTDNPFVFQFIWTLIDVVMLTIILKRECPKHFLLAFAFLIPFFDGVQINLFRNIKSILIFFWAIKYIRERNFFKYLIWIVFAASIHITAFLYLPLYFLINKPSAKVHKGIAIFCIFFCFIGITFFQDYLLIASAIIGGKVDQMAIKYTSENSLAGGITMGLLFRVIMLGLLLLYYKKLEKSNLAMLNTALLYLELAICFNPLLVLRDRFSVLFVLGIICILPLFIESIKRNKFRLPIMAFLYLFMFGYVHIQHATPVAKYENLLFGISERSKAEQRIFNDIIDLDRVDN